MAICQSYKPCVPTDELENWIKSGQWKCNCTQLHSQFGVLLVNGHVFTRDFTWLSRMSPGLDPAGFEQNMKNRLVPP